MPGAFWDWRARRIGRGRCRARNCCSWWWNYAPLSFRRDDTSKSNIVATALFGDGAAAAIVSTEGDGPAFGPGGEHLFPESLDIMGWDVGEDGLKAIFPATFRCSCARKCATPPACSWRGMGSISTTSTVSSATPAAPKWWPALEEAFGLAENTLSVERGVLRDYGNMSAATLLFVLERVMKQKPRGRLLLDGNGTGLHRRVPV